MEETVMIIERQKSRTLFFCVLVSIPLVLFSACSKQPPTPGNLPLVQDPGKPTPTPDKIPVDVIADFVFAGWMGDGERYGKDAITFDDAFTENPHSAPTCVKVTYRPRGQKWAGIYAQYNVKEEGYNWGQYPGKDLTDCTKLVFWAKGEQGVEKVEFKAGGIDAPGMKYRDSFELSLGTVTLNPTWTRYEMNLAGKDLSSVIGGFCWVATARSNPNGLTFYIDSITYE
jgi:hypothetical protein